MQVSLFRVGRLFCLFSLVYLPSLRADSPPKGFEDPALFQRVMNGEIVMTETVNTKTEFRTYYRGFFNKVSPTAYAALIVNYPKYPDLIEGITSAKQTGVNADRTEYTYQLEMEVAIGPFSQTVYPEGKHTLVIAGVPAAESVVKNEITNYKEYLKFATETTRLIPYQTGILVEDDVHCEILKASAASNMVKVKLQKTFSQYLTAFRTDLQGNY